jgi:hypothetical protein
MRWGAKEWTDFYAFTGPSPGPYFNNMSVRVSGTSASGVPCESGCNPATSGTNASLPPFELRQNYPNPFNPSTTIAFALTEAGPVRLQIYDVAGRLVRTLINGQREADFYRIEWNGLDDAGVSVASGVYFYRLEAGQHRATKRLVLLK